MNAAFSGTVSGRVQMVMFRDFTLREAQRLGLVGEVRNHEDGTVRVYAEGEKEKLDAFIKILKRGPWLARVDEVRVEWLDPVGTYDRFNVRYP